MAVNVPIQPNLSQPLPVEELTDEQVKMQKDVHDHFSQPEYKIPDVESPELTESVST